MKLPRATYARTLATEARATARREAEQANLEIATPSPRRPRKPATVPLSSLVENDVAEPEAEPAVSPPRPECAVPISAHARFARWIETGVVISPDEEFEGRSDERQPGGIER